MIVFFYRRRTGTAQIRAVQIAPDLGALQNPSAVPDGAVCVVIKAHPDTLGRSLPRERTVVDLVDQYRLVDPLQAQPEIPVIVASRHALLSLSQTHTNPLILIPQQHCNPDRQIRQPRPVRVVGYIGDARALDAVAPALGELLASHGLTFVTEYRARTREAVVAFYQAIDLQLAWRVPLPPRIQQLKPSLKLANAGSFGIPSVARPEPAFVDEFKGSFLPAESVEEVVSELVRLRDHPLLYAELAGRGLERAEAYHLSKILPLYRDLEARWT